jgi:hypothetical protein
MLSNKELVGQIFDELAKGNGRPLIDNATDDFCWTVTGSTSWSKTYSGKSAVVAELFGALRARLTGPVTIIADRVLADLDCVCIEAHGDNMTQEGRPYNNRYCFVFRLENGRIAEVTEYMDTELAASALGAYTAPPTS